MRETEATGAALRAVEICNACRYCEGYCAVFPAMELQRDFTTADMAYFANLCHGCNGCFHACQFAPPHPFGINLPKTLAEVRLDSYAEYARPAALRGAFARSGVTTALLVAAGLAVVLALVLAVVPGDVLFAPQTGAGAFYRIVPWGVMSLVAGATLLFSAGAILAAMVAFWRDTRSSLSGTVGPVSLAVALRDVATLRYLGGGGDGCNDLGEGFTQLRRWMHHALAYGFLFCFAATSVATWYHHGLGLEAPYALLSLPVVLGTIGGVLMVVGCGGLVWVKMGTDPQPVARRLLGAEYGLLVLLLVVAVSGLALLAWRSTSAMGLLLAVHLGAVLALFVVLPYGKFIHGPLRAVALLKAAVERRGRAPSAG